MLSKTQVRRRSPDISAPEQTLMRILSSLSDSTRFKLFKLLAKYDDMCVTDLAHACDISPPAASQQLKIMEQSGLVSRTRQGQIACYHINTANAQVKQITKIITNL